MPRLALGLAALAASLIAALALPLWPALHVTHDGQTVATLRGEELTISYVHSIDRLPIEEDLRVQDGDFVVERTRLRQFGAGMGQIEGEGHGYADGSWWVVDDLERSIGAELLVRVGRPQVDHRIAVGDTEVVLSGCLAGERVAITPHRLSTAALLLGTDQHDETDCAPPAVAESEER